jgi:hypothetical protein
MADSDAVSIDASPGITASPAQLPEGAIRLDRTSNWGRKRLRRRRIFHAPCRCRRDWEINKTPENFFSIPAKASEKLDEMVLTF